MNQFDQYCYHFQKIRKINIQQRSISKNKKIIKNELNLKKTSKEQVSEVSKYQLNQSKLICHSQIKVKSQSLDIRALCQARAQSFCTNLANTISTFKNDKIDIQQRSSQKSQKYKQKLMEELVSQTNTNQTKPNYSVSLSVTHKLKLRVKDQRLKHYANSDPNLEAPISPILLYLLKIIKINKYLKE